MPKFIIERDIPEIGSADADALKAAAAKSNAVLAEMQSEHKDIAWDYSYVAGDKTFCVYNCANAELIEEHSQRSGFPASIVTEVEAQISPATAKS
ncbi:nickel-binding protein [Neptuniibacter sp. PT8_73]|uniref:nickel-binding protein n=1 Tax=unclassified Neptuniibacter TaxID=2630693 RepID=UPI0039F73AA8